MALPDPRPRRDILRLERHGDGKVVGYYGWTDGRWVPVNSLTELRLLMDSKPIIEAPDAHTAMLMFGNSLSDDRS